MPCIHRKRHWHFLNCGKAQTPSLEPIPEVIEESSLWKGFPKQISFHQLSCREPQVHLLCLSLPHQEQPKQQHRSEVVSTQPEKTYKTKWSQKNPNLRKVYACLKFSRVYFNRLSNLNLSA